MASTTTPSNDRPAASIAEVWSQARAWDQTSVKLKRSQNAVRGVALSFGLAGAACGTAVGLPYEWSLFGAGGREILAGAAAALVGLAGYIGRELLTPDRETEWSRSRLLAEALQREVWRALMRVSPYDAEGAGVALVERAERYLENIGLPKAPVVEPDTSVPAANTIEDYIAKRVRGQIGYYERTAARHQRRLGWYRRTTFLLGALAVLAGLGGMKEAGLALWVPVITTASAAVVALRQAGRLQDLVPLFQETAVQLRFLVARWEDEAALRSQWLASDETDKLREAESTFVNTCETILARENESWRAEWVTEETAKAVESALATARKAAGQDQ